MVDAAGTYQDRRDSGGKRAYIPTCMESDDDKEPIPLQDSISSSSLLHLIKAFLSGRKLGLWNSAFGGKHKHGSGRGSIPSCCRSS